MTFELPASLFARTAVPVTEADWQGMQDMVQAIEQVVAMPAWNAHVLARQPGLAAAPSGSPGVFFGYDFHLGPEGPQLIEVNTNAGGGVLNALAQEVGLWPSVAPRPGLVDTLVAMFRQEWACHADTPLQSMVIVDEQPEAQFLYPEFLALREVLAGQGIDALICDPSALGWQDGQLCADGRPVQLVYNRLTDFALAGEALTALRQAWLADAVVVTPHPVAYARYADKRNLALWSDHAFLRGLGVPEETLVVLQAHLPPTRVVVADEADSLWALRKQLFFKPMTGFGSRAAYRGDKLTKRVFAEILAGDYVVQRLAPPEEHLVPVSGEEGQTELIPLKYDLRLYVYRGHIQLACARLWQGQTTNFRTPGGGFAPLIIT